MPGGRGSIREVELVVGVTPGPGLGGGVGRQRTAGQRQRHVSQTSMPELSLACLVLRYGLTPVRSHAEGFFVS